MCSFVCRCWTLSGRMSTYWCWALRTQWLWSEADTDQHPQQLSPFLSMTSMKGPFCLKVIMKSLSEKGRSQDGLLPQSEVMTLTLIQSGKVLFHSFKLVQNNTNCIYTSIPTLQHVPAVLFINNLWEIPQINYSQLTQIPHSQNLNHTGEIHYLLKN